jgi:hypothetical protein
MATAIRDETTGRDDGDTAAVIVATTAYSDESLRCERGLTTQSTSRRASKGNGDGEKRGKRPRGNPDRADALGVLPHQWRGEPRARA